MEIFHGRDKAEPRITGLGEKVQVTRDRLTLVPKRVANIEAYPVRLQDGTAVIDESEVDVTFREFLGEHKEVFRVEPEELELVSAKKINNRWYVKYSQMHKGIPVHHATVGMDASETGRVGSYTANYQPDIDVPTDPKVGVEEAAKTAMNSYPAPGRPKLVAKSDELVIYPEVVDNQVIYHLAWKILIVGEVFNPEIEKYFFIDAIDGKIIEDYTARFPGAQISGKVQLEIYPAVPTDAVSTMPADDIYVDIDDAGKETTNSNGDFSKYVSWWWLFLHGTQGIARVSLDGPYVRVQDSDGSNFTETQSCNTLAPCNITFSDTDRDHLNLFYHMNLFHDWLKDEIGYAWINPWNNSNRFNARVNYTFNNAYAGDPMTFGTNNYARCSDVIYHECTHNVLFQLYGDYIGWPAALTEGYAMDEGFADYYACSFTNDSEMGEGVFGHARDLDNNMSYAGRSSYNLEGHTGGTIIGGAAWDLRQRLIQIYGATGARIADQLLFEAHQILSTYPRSYFFSDPHESNLLTALYRAADTDNNLLNGFPYFMDIQRAFHAHDLLQVKLENQDSFDFSTNTLGWLGGGDLYYSGGKFWANNVGQNGVADLGDIGAADLTTVNIPTSGYTRFGVTATEDHTYITKAQDGEEGSYVAFRVLDTSGSTVTLEYFYRYIPFWYIANLNTKEIHKPECRWVSHMAESNKSFAKSLQKVADLIEDDGYNGCHFCLPRYDTDTKSLATVLVNLAADLP